MSNALRTSSFERGQELHLLKTFSGLTSRLRICYKEASFRPRNNRIRDMEQEPAINHQVCKHEASHLLVAHLLQGVGAIKLLQLPGHHDLKTSLRANCVMGDWFVEVNRPHLSIPTLMAGVIADQLAGTPFAFCRDDMTRIAERSLYLEDAHAGYFAKIVHEILSAPKGNDALEAVATRIEFAYKKGEDRIEGDKLHKMFAKLLGNKFKFKRPQSSMMLFRPAPQITQWEVERVIARRIYSEILDAVPAIDIPGFR